MNFETLPGAFQEGEGYEPILRSELAWSDENTQDRAALKVVLQDLSKAEGYLQSRSYPTQWNVFDRLWQFEMVRQNWEGTNIPRSYLGIPLVLTHEESILPQVTLGIFADSTPFTVDPRPMTNMDEARANTALLSWELDNINFREEFRKLAKSALIYGTGVGKWGWESFSRKRKVYKRKSEPITIDMGVGTANIHPPEEDEIEVIETEEQINRPVFQHVNIRHILVDPQLRCMDIREAKYVIHVMYMGLDEIDALRDVEGYKNIPPRAELEKLAATNESAKEAAYTNSLESRGMELGLQRDFRAMPRPDVATADPLKQPFEVLEYWTRDRVFTVIQRKLLVRNDRNEFGKIPFVSSSFIDVLDNFYGIGLGRLLGNEQRMQQGVLNNAMDVLSLNTGGMFVRKRGLNAPNQSVRVYPGAAIDVDDPNGFKPLDRQDGVLGEALAAISASDARAQRHSGANEMAVQGAIGKGTNAMRTATGVEMVTSGSGSRLQYFVENLSNLVLIPTLEAFNEMNVMKLRPSQVKQILSEELDLAYEKDVLNIFNTTFKFKVLASAKLQARRQLMQTLPMFFQFVANEPVMNGLAQSGKKLNWEELVNMVFDASGWPNKGSLIVDLTDEDMQRMQQMNPAMQQAAMQQQKIQAEAQAKSELLQQNNEDKVARDLIKEQLKHELNGGIEAMDGK